MSHSLLKTGFRKIWYQIVVTVWYQIACQVLQKLIPVFSADFWYMCHWH